MAKQPLTVDVFISVDGWARGEHSPAFFGYGGPELGEWIDAELSRPQVVLFGRRTYEALAPDDGQAAGDRLTELPKIVFSSTLSTAAWPNTTIARDLVAEVERLKRDSDVSLRTMGSLSIVRQLIGAGLVDRLRLMTFPLLVGPSGREPLFDDVIESDLDLVDTRVMDGRVVLLDYRPTGRGIPTAELTG